MRFGHVLHLGGWKPTGEGVVSYLNSCRITIHRSLVILNFVCFFFPMDMVFISSKSLPGPYDFYFLICFFLDFIT